LQAVATAVIIQAVTNEDMDFISNLFRSLETELKKDIAEVRHELRDEIRGVAARQDQTNARLERIGGIVNGGARAIAKMIEWTERTDVSLADVLRRQAEFDQRLRKLESEKS
jgi:hypothetical protein